MSGAIVVVGAPALCVPPGPEAKGWLVKTNPFWGAAGSGPTRRSVNSEPRSGQAALTFLRRGAGLPETRAPTRLPGRPIAADRYGRIAPQPRAAGGPIPVSDIWIAAPTLEYGADPVTADRHFEHVPGLVPIDPADSAR